MIDLHCHILPDLDDGSPSLEASVSMARLAAEAGTTDLVASPHSDLQFAFDPLLAEAKISELSAACDGVVRLHYGCDFHLHYENVQKALAEPSRFAINHKCYLLVELSELLVMKTTEEILERLRAAGIIPIVTHPERNDVLQHHVEKLERWVGDGCCLQVTAQSLLGRFGSKARGFSLELLTRGVVHFVASDGHDCRNRPPRLDEAFEFVSDRFGAETAERLFHANPKAVLAGAALSSVEPGASRTRRKWWQLWK